MENSKDFMLIFRFEADPAYQPTEEELNTDHQRWTNWIGAIAAQAKFAGTHRLGFEAKQIFADASVTDGPTLSGQAMVGGNMIIKALTIEEAVEIAKGCPVLTMGGAVEVRDIIPMEL